MSFFHIANKPARLTGAGKTSIELLHKAECGACPLNHQAGLKNPNMKPTGTGKPMVYFLGEAPGADEDKRGKQFVGSAGRALRMRIPRDWERDIRWNNVVRTRPPGNRTPEFVEIECCRPSIIRDIEATKPVAIFGFGNIPLQWALNTGGILKWNGRRAPVKIGNHTCWFYPMILPSYIVRTRRYEPRGNGYGSDIEFVFALNMRNALDEIDKGLPTPVVHTAEQALAGIELIDGSNGDADVQAVVSALKYFAAQSHIGFDYETKGLRPYYKDAKILTVGLSSRKRTVAFVLHHSQGKWTHNQLQRVEQAFEDFLYDAKCIKVVHNLPFEMEWTGYFYGWKSLRAGKWACTASMAFLLDERMNMGKPDPLSLEFLTIQYFGLNIKTLNTINVKDLDTADLTQVLTYNGMDARYHLALHDPQMDRLRKAKLLNVYKHHLARIPTMALTQLKGVPVHQPTVRKFAKRFEQEIRDAEAAIAAMPIVKTFQSRTGHSFRPSAEKDVRLLITKHLGQAIEGTDEKQLETVRHPIAKAIIAYRKPAKNLSTYVEPLKEGSPHVMPDGLLHPQMNLMRTVTWRTASEDPNVQNFPKRKLKEVRSQIKPKADERVVSFDLGQIQARNVAMESQDPVLIKAFWDRYDIHTDWMERLVRVYPRWVTEGARELARDKTLAKAYRNRSKNEFVFPSFFGAQSKSVASYLGIPLNIAERLHEQFWDIFGGIKGWHDDLDAHYKKHGWVTGLSGFIRRAPVSPNQLINAPIQGDEAIMVCDAMNRLSEIGDERLQANMEIHDDLTFIWNVRDIDELAPIVIREMTNISFDWINVPILVEMSVGKDWATQEEIGNYSSDTWDGKTVYEKNSKPEWASGSWSDGTGWANHNGGEKHVQRR